MGGRHRAAEPVGERGIDAALLGEAVEGCRLVEPAHLDRPFDRLTGAVERQPSVRLARDRRHSAIDLGCKCPVDRKLRLARGLALFQGRIVEKGKA